MSSNQDLANNTVWHSKSTFLHASILIALLLLAASENMTKRLKADERKAVKRKTLSDAFACISTIHGGERGKTRVYLCFSSLTLACRVS